MTEDIEEIVVGPGEVDIDAHRVAEIIFAFCRPVSPEEAGMAANLVVEYLIEQLSKAKARKVRGGVEP